MTISITKCVLAVLAVSLSSAQATDEACEVCSNNGSVRSRWSFAFWTQGRCDCDENWDGECCEISTSPVVTSAPTTAPPTTAPPSSTPAPSTCPPRVRQAWSTLGCEERQHFIDAVRTFQREDRAIYDEFSATHSELFGYAHGASAFLHWHRWFLVGYENQLRSYPGFECVTLPYWDWEIDADNIADSPAFAADTFGTTATMQRGQCLTDGLSANWPSVNPGQTCLQRNFNENAWTIAGPARLVDLIINTPDFETFRPAFEAQPHSAPHVILGGDMATGFSPSDPLFFVHHCNVDRIFSLWQDYHGYDEVAASELTEMHYFPAVDRNQDIRRFSLDSVMQFANEAGEVADVLRGEVTVRDMNDPTALGDNSYTYGTDFLAQTIGEPRTGSWHYAVPGQAELVQCPAGGRRVRRAAVGGLLGSILAAKRKAPRKAFTNPAVQQAFEKGASACELALMECEGKPASISDEMILKMNMDPVKQRKFFQACPDHCL